MNTLDTLCEGLNELELRVVRRMRDMGKHEEDLERVARRLLVLSAIRGGLTEPLNRIAWREEAADGFLLATMATVIADL